MTIAEKLTAIAENEQRVYDAGYAIGASAYNFLLNEVYAISFSSSKNLTEFDMTPFRRLGGSLSYSFAYCNNLLEFTISENQTPINYGGCFYNCASLVSVRKLNFSNCNSTGSVASIFHGCTSLRDIEIVPQTLKVSITIPSDKLTDESIQSIIDGLADLTGGTAQTLVLHSVVSAKLSDEQLDTVSAKNWIIQ